jgi:hypothetical protein
LRVRRLLLASLAAVAVPLAGCTLPNASRLATDAADPSVRWDGTQYVLQTTNNAYGNVPTWTSPDLGTWTFAGDALPTLPSWAQPGWTWAPTSIQRSDGKWFLFFSAAMRGRTTANGEPLKCIGVASAASAAGPFTVVKERDAAPLLCEPELGGTIDPSAFRMNGNGNVYLVTKADGNSSALPTRIENRRLAANLWSLAPMAPTVLLKSTTGTWEEQVIEGPDLTITAGNKLHLIYSGGDFAKPTYGEGQAQCASTSRTCVRNGRLINGSTYGTGAGGASTFRSPTGALLLAWHAYTTAGSTQRSLLLGTMAVDRNGVLSVTGSPVPAAPSGGTAAPAQRAAGVPAGTQLTVPADQPITVPNAHTR